MSENDITLLVFDFIITAFLYMIVPIIIFFSKKEIIKEKAKVISIVNSIVVFFVFVILYIVLERDLNILTGGSAFFYGGINYWILFKRVKVEKHEYPNEQQENNDLQSLIEKLESNKSEEK